MHCYRWWFPSPIWMGCPLQDIDTRVGCIRARLAAVFEEWFSIPPSDHMHDIVIDDGPEAKRAKIVTDRPATDTLKQLESATKHKIRKLAPSRWACESCLETVNPLHPVSLQHWLTGSCIKLPKPPWVHYTHHYFQRECLHVCLRCGAHSSGGARVVRLKGVCSPPYQLQWLKDNSFVS